MTIGQDLDAALAMQAETTRLNKDRLDGHSTRLMAAETDLISLKVDLAAALARIAKLEQGQPGPVPEDPPPPPPPGPVLTLRAAPIATAVDGEVIEFLDLDVTGAHAITVRHKNVTIRNCRIRHDRNAIYAHSASGLVIENVETTHRNPPSGINGYSSPDEHIAIRILSSPDARVSQVSMYDASSGLYFVDSPRATVSAIRGWNLRGDFPRGQLIQFDKSGGSVLDGFICFNQMDRSRPEDNVSVYNSPNVTIRNGLLDGNNSRTGVGIMFELGSTGGRVYDVDVRNQGNGAFSGYERDVEFHRCRAFDSHNKDWGRGVPASNSLSFAAAGNATSGSVGFYACGYRNLANPGNLYWDAGRMRAREFTALNESVTPRSPEACGFVHFWNV